MESSSQFQDAGIYQGQNIRKSKKKKSKKINRERVIQLSNNFMSEMGCKAYKIDVSEYRFLDLSRNPQMVNFDEKSIFEKRFGGRSSRFLS